MGEGLNKTICRYNQTIIEVRTSQASSYVPRPPRPTYLNTNALRTSTTRRKDLFGGSIHYVWRLHSLHLEAPFITFGGSIHYVWRLQTRLSQSLRPCLMLFLRKNFMHYTGNSVNKDRFMSQSPFHYKTWCIPSLQRL